MVTIIDVAAYAGVSKSTVSAVLNNGPHVTEKTRLRVEEAIQALGYVRNQNASGLRTRQTKCLGVITAFESLDTQSYEFNFEAGQFSYAVSNGIPDGLTGSDYGLITERYCAKEMGDALPAIVKNARVDGVLLVGSLFSQALVDKLLTQNIPVVGVGRSYDTIDCVLPDIAEGMYLQAEELIRRGSRNIALINCPSEFVTSVDRTNGWHKALTELGQNLTAAWETCCSSNTGEGGYRAMKALWESGARPDGLVTAHEAIALGAMRFLYEQGLRIPEDISITSYETSVLGSYSIPPLTSVNIKKEEMGAIAARMLLRRIEHPEAPLQKQIITPELVTRASVSPK